MSYLIALTLFLSPAYALRFKLFNLPNNLLMLWVFFVWLAFIFHLLMQHQGRNFIGFIKLLDKKFLALVLLFFASGIVSLFWRGLSFEKLGLFLVLFLQPISLYFIAKFIFEKFSPAKNLLSAAYYLLLGAAGAYAVVQYFTLAGLPGAWWGNSMEPKRALAFFSHPNFYALFAAPLLAFLLPDVGLKLKDFKKFWPWLIIYAVGCVGLLLSLSRAGWLGLGAAILVYAIVANDRKIKKIILFAGFAISVVIVLVPNLRYRFILPFYDEKSAVSRLSLWQSGLKGIKESPIFGLGLGGFAKNWARLNTDPSLTQTHNFPHNIFLDAWVETGLMGLISLMGVMGVMIYRGFVDRENILKLGVALFLVALIAQGQIDNPYFKNDLAVVFWIVLALV